MFGTNPIAKVEYTDGKTLKVHETFETIQGEGPFAGIPAFFIRLSHCSLACTWCDTDFSHEIQMSINEIADRAFKWRSLGNGRNLVVITGGEPLINNLVPLFTLLSDHGFHTQVETAGIHPVLPPGYKAGSELYLRSDGPPLPMSGFTSIVCSPKTPKVHKQIENYALAFKYIIGAGDKVSDNGIPITNTQIKDGPQRELFYPKKQMKWPDPPTIYIQPRDDYNKELNLENLKMAADVCQRYGHRLSVQLHKLCNLP